MSIKFVCLGERKIIGEIEKGKVTRLTGQSIWREFVPVSSEYQLFGTVPKDGQYMFCPRCRAHVAIERAGYVVNETTPRGARAPAMTREECRRSMVASVQADEYVNSDSMELDRPLILGAARLTEKQ